MRKRRLFWVLLLVFGVGVGVIVAGVFRAREPSEPEYGGKKLNEWVGRYGHFVRIFGAGPETSGFRSESEEVIRHIGTNTIPYLVKWIRYEPSLWKEKLYAAVNPIIGSFDPSWQLTTTKKSEMAFGAMGALIALGPRAEGAVPALTDIINDTNAPGSAAGRASQVLFSLGNAGLPPLLAVLTNPKSKHRAMVAFKFGLLGTNARSAVPALMNLCMDTHLYVRVGATNALRKIDPQALGNAGNR